MPLKGQTAQWPSRWGSGGPELGLGPCPEASQTAPGPTGSLGAGLPPRSSRAPRLALGPATASGCIPRRPRTSDGWDRPVSLGLLQGVEESWWRVGLGRGS